MQKKVVIEFMTIVNLLQSADLEHHTGLKRVVVDRIFPILLHNLSADSDSTRLNTKVVLMSILRTKYVKDFDVEIRLCTGILALLKSPKNNNKRLQEEMIVVSTNMHFLLD